MNMSIPPPMRSPANPLPRRTQTSLHLAPDLPLDEWRRIGVELANLEKRVPWWLGDWMFHGETNYSAGMSQSYEDAIAATGLDYQTLANYKMVAGRFAFSRRREKLTISHHLEVIALDLDDQEHWLNRAEREKWGHKTLRNELHATASPRERAALALVPLRVDQALVERWREAAAMKGQDVRVWAALELDRAAQRVLEPGSEAA
jgi:hypothetical protein